MRMPATLVVFCAAFAGCQGPMGPEGPQGPQGEPGPAGVPHHFNATVDADGSALALLPTEAGTLAKPPGLTCYLREPGQTYWYVVGLDTFDFEGETYLGISCLLAQQGTSLSAFVINAPTGWLVLFTAIY